MNLIEKVFSFFKNIFSRKEKIKMLEESEESEMNVEKIDFVESLKVKEIKKKKYKIETLVCPGDGLGIQTKISG